MTRQTLEGLTFAPAEVCINQAFYIPWAEGRSAGSWSGWGHSGLWVCLWWSHLRCPLSPEEPLLPPYSTSEPKERQRDVSVKVGSEVGTVAGFDSCLWEGLSVWSLHVPFVFVWLSSRSGLFRLMSLFRNWLKSWHTHHRGTFSAALRPPTAPT